MSVYLGDVLDNLVNDLVAAYNKENPSEGSDSAAGPEGLRKRMIAQQSVLSLGTPVGTMRRDRTDRNRTSPYAFTGNKFEFRAPGSSSEVGASCTILNLITAAAIRDITAEVRAEIEKEKASGGDKIAAIRRVVCRTLKKHQRVVFNGDGYSQSWVEEAARRGLPNLRDTVTALHEYNNAKNTELFTSFSVLTKAEVDARSVIQFHAWTEQTLTEALALNNIVSTHIIPSGLKQQTELAQSIRAVQKLGADIALDEQKDFLKELTSTLNTLIAENKKLQGLLHHKQHGDNSEATAIHVRDNIKPVVVAVRHAADRLETMVDDTYWTLPKYQEILNFK